MIDVAFFMERKLTNGDIVEICLNDVCFDEERKVTYADRVKIWMSDTCFKKTG